MSSTVMIIINNDICAFWIKLVNALDLINIEVVYKCAGVIMHYVSM